MAVGQWQAAPGKYNYCQSMPTKCHQSQSMAHQYLAITINYAQYYAMSIANQDSESILVRVSKTRPVSDNDDPCQPIPSH
eukprot:11180658-Lingulodinium_polyedra.AAC.1